MAGTDWLHGILAASAKLQKATSFRFDLSASLELESHWTDFREI
jgi:hypothetical protein